MTKSTSEKFLTDMRILEYRKKYFPFKDLFNEEVECEATEEFVHFIGKSGIVKILIDAVSTLSNLPVKPDSPVKWLKTYFRKDAPGREDDMTNEIVALRNEITETASKVSYLREEVFAKMKLLRHLKECQLNGQCSETAGSDLVIEKMYSPWEIQPDPFFRTTSSTQMLFKEIIRRGERKVSDPSGMEKISKSKMESGQSSEEEMSAESEEMGRYAENKCREEKLAQQLLDKDNMGGYNFHERLTITSADKTDVKYLHLNSPADSSDSEENLRKELYLKGSTIFVQDTKRSSSASTEREESFLPTDQNPTMDSIKKSKKAKGHPSPRKNSTGSGKHKSEEKKEAIKNKKNDPKSNKHSQKHHHENYSQELQAEDDVPAHHGKINDLPNWNNEKNWENIPDSYWKTHLHFPIQDDSEESDSEESWAAFLSKFNLPLDRRGGDNVLESLTKKLVRDGVESEHTQIPLREQAGQLDVDISSGTLETYKSKI